VPFTCVWPPSCHREVGRRAVKRTRKSCCAVGGGGVVALSRMAVDGPLVTFCRDNQNVDCSFLVVSDPELRIQRT
jgi:hypothetical protein